MRRRQAHLIKRTWHVVCARKRTAHSAQPERERALAELSLLYAFDVELLCVGCYLLHAAPKVIHCLAFTSHRMLLLNYRAAS